ncbi:hypothetical protein, partial [Enterococcus faecium]|uniref:hypothetical protein n=1 Tax=Enterococcus faecium TaxID=1352 RepID=UPI003CC53D42
VFCILKFNFLAKVVLKMYHEQFFKKGNEKNKNGNLVGAKRFIEEHNKQLLERAEPEYRSYNKLKVISL